MASIPNETTGVQGALSANQRRDIMRNLSSVAARLANSQIDGLTSKLSDTLFTLSESSADPKKSSLTFNASNLLKRNGYAFYHLASAQLESSLQKEVEKLEHEVHGNVAINALELSLVTYEEMEQKVQIESLSRQFEQHNTEQLNALGKRLAVLTGRDNVPLAMNPFRPAVFITALNNAWSEFSDDDGARGLVLPLFSPETFLDLAPILKALNTALIAKNILPELTDAYSIKKSAGPHETTKNEAAADSALLNQLKRIFTAPQNQPDFAGTPPSFSGTSAEFPSLGLPMMGNERLFNHLADIQRRSANVQSSTRSEPGDISGAMLLPQIKQQMPSGALTHMDERTIDLLTNVFGTVFRDPHIPSEIKELIGYLQVPVLKTALIDKNFFFEDTHPARRLIDLLTRSSVSWNQEKGQEDPLYQTIKRNVDRVQRALDDEVNLFSEVVSDLESFIEKEDAAANTALEAPISQALQQEKYRQAGTSAQSEVAMRIGTGEVIAFVETFLEHKWVPVLTLAYRVREEKPQVLENAIKTMDDLIWSVKPKITKAQRQELITKLPSILAMLNKWLTVIKWEDADRLQFFADLAECHASIVRAPLDLSPDRQLEIAVEVAQKAAERRLQLRANEKPEVEPDEFGHLVHTLERGAWLEFLQADGSQKKFKLAWVSPLRSFYIFTSSQKEEGFSFQVEELEQSLRTARARLVVLDKLVERALTESLENAEAEEETAQVMSLA